MALSLNEKNDLFLIAPPTRSLTQRLPYGLLYLSSYLESKGEKNTILDFKGVSTKEAYNKIKQKILEEQPKFIGITCTIFEMDIVKDMCDFIKNNSKKSIIIIGGPSPSICPNHFIEKNINFDYLVIGEGELTFCELIKNLRNPKNVENIKGIAYLKSGKLKINDPRELIKDLNQLPFPAYDKVDMDYYCRPNVWGIRPIYISNFTIYTVRGCPYNCNFCVAHTIWGKRVRMMSPERVVEHIEYVLKKFKVDAFQFGDESFTISKERIYKIFNLLKEKNIKVLFGCQTRVDLLDEDLLKFLKKNGCIQIDFGIEAATDRMLKIMNKQTTVERAVKVARGCRKFKIRQVANMLINLPGETIGDIETYLKFVKDMKYNLVCWNVYCPYPGVNWGKKLDIEDLDMILRHPSDETYDLLERKYKFGDYDKPIKEIVAYLYKNTFHPKNLKFSLELNYWRSMFSCISYIWDLRYIIQILKSKRKMQYVTNLLTQKTIS